MWWLLVWAGRREGEKKGGKEGERDVARPVYQLPSLFHEEAVALGARLPAVAILHSFHTCHWCSKRPWHHTRVCDFKFKFSSLEIKRKLYLKKTNKKNPPPKTANESSFHVPGINWRYGLTLPETQKVFAWCRRLKRPLRPCRIPFCFCKTKRFANHALISERSQKCLLC